MTPLNANEDVSDIDTKAPAKTKGTLYVMCTAEFPNITPAHARYITKEGQGSNTSRAVRDAVANVFKDARLKGKKAKGMLPAKMTIQFGRQG